MSRLGQGRETGGVEAALDRHVDSDGQQISGTEKRLSSKYAGKGRQRGKSRTVGRKSASRGRR